MPEKGMYQFSLLSSGFLTSDKAYIPILHAWLKAVLPPIKVAIIPTRKCFIYSIQQESYQNGVLIYFPITSIG